jgi:hypothetical protein
MLRMVPAISSDFLGALGEAADLAGDDGKTATVFTGAGSFNGRVEANRLVCSLIS